MLVQRGAALVVIDSANIYDTNGLRPVHAVRWAAGSHRGTPHCLGWPSEVQCPPCHRSPGVRGLVVFPMGPFGTLPRWAISPTVGTGLRTLWSIPIR